VVTWLFSNNECLPHFVAFIFILDLRPRYVIQTPHGFIINHPCQLTMKKSNSKSQWSLCPNNLVYLDQIRLCNITNNRR
jgi:hypothetical protein